MALTSTDKSQIIEKFKKSDKDTGSSEVQIALLTARILYLTEHLKAHKHDVHTRYGLMKLVSKRKRHLKYLKAVNFVSYRKVIEALDVRG